MIWGYLGLAVLGTIGTIRFPRHDEALTTVLFCLFLLLLIGDVFKWTS